MPEVPRFAKDSERDINSGKSEVVQLGRKEPATSNLGISMGNFKMKAKPSH